MADEREATAGEVLVGLTFNPSGDGAVYECKKRFADAIDQLASVQNEVAQQAIGHVMTAQMWAVKALTWGR